MFEHVGRKFYNKFFKSINKLLKKDGSFLLHTIGVVDKPSPPNKFINRYIFPWWNLSVFKSNYQINRKNWTNSFRY